MQLSAELCGVFRVESKISQALKETCLLTQNSSWSLDSSLSVYPCRVANQGLTPKLEAVLAGFSNFRFRLFSGWNFVIDFFTITFLAEPKLNPGVFELPCTGKDRAEVVPGRVNPRWFDRTKSSSEEETELLECGLLKTLGRLRETSLFSVPFCLIDDGMFFLSDFSSLTGMFFTSINAFRSSPPRFERGEGSEREKNIYFSKLYGIPHELYNTRICKLVCPPTYRPTYIPTYLPTDKYEKERTNISLTVESRSFESPRETKIGSKNRIAREIGDKIAAFDWGEGNNFWFELSGSSKKRGFDKSGFHYISLLLTAFKVACWYRSQRWYGLKRFLRGNGSELNSNYRVFLWFVRKEAGR